MCLTFPRKSLFLINYALEEFDTFFPLTSLHANIDKIPSCCKGLIYRHAIYFIATMSINIYMYISL